MPYFDVFMTIVHRRYGHFLFMPFPGSVMEQPHRFMMIMKIMQGVYCNVLAKKDGGSV